MEGNGREREVISTWTLNSCRCFAPRHFSWLLKATVQFRPYKSQAMVSKTEAILATTTTTTAEEKKNKKERTNGEWNLI